MRMFVLLALFYSLNGASYRYVCNGILANGVQRNDDCGVCDDEHAARWDNPNIPVVVDLSSLPQGINARDWQGVVNDSFAAWNTISGSSLRFFEIERDNARNFGIDESLHEIFWVKDPEEWRLLVGVGEFGTLGATLPRYSCGGSQGSNRRIIDADLVMNGVENDKGTQYINWRVQCDEDDDECISIQTTLVHELGHFLGLDHPCLMCSSSIMSARAGYDLMLPTKDDINGLKALYPQSTSTPFGALCSPEQPCADNYDCITRHGSSYCSKRCEEDNWCDKGGVCENHDGIKMCVLVAEGSAPLRKIGQNCTRVGCEAGLLCIGSNNEFYCYAGCEENSDCERKESCAVIGDGSMICALIKSKGEKCNKPAACDTDFACVVSKDVGYCRDYCNYSDYPQTGCMANEYCTSIENTPICLPEKDELVLNENSTNFNRDPKTQPGLGRIGKKAEESPGCATYTNSTIFVWFFMAVYMVFVRKKHYKRSNP